jgi:glycosyltransferase involved in cell wall biosynthesis
MRPLTILHTEWSTGWAGQEMRIINEARGVAAHGHRVVIVACPDAKILPCARAARLVTHEVRMRHGFDLRAIRQLRAIIRSEHADILNTHSSVDSWVGGFAAKLSGVKLVRTRHVSRPVSRHPLNFVHRMPDAIITTGEAVRQRLITYNGLSPDRVVSVPTGVDIAHFCPQPRQPEVRAALGVPADAKVVTMVAAFRPQKRHDVLLKAVTLLRQWPDLYVVLVGEGGALVEPLARELGLGSRVVSPGHVDDIRPILSASDIVASASDTEGVPQSIAQALAMALPVVHTDVGSVGELIEHEHTGLLVPSGEPQALAAGIERFLREPSLARDCGRRGREHVRIHHSHDRMIKRVLEIYELLTIRTS